jgi:hypothetical protein
VHRASSSRLGNSSSYSYSCFTGDTTRGDAFEIAAKVVVSGVRGGGVEKELAAKCPQAKHQEMVNSILMLHGEVQAITLSPDEDNQSLVTFSKVFVHT